MKLYGIVGAGGFGREIMPLVQRNLESSENRHDYKCVFIVEDGYEINEKNVNGLDVIKMSKFLSMNADEKYFNIGIGDSHARERISNNIPSDIAKPFSIYPESHISLSDNNVGKGGVFCSFTHITSNAKIGSFFHCNIYSYVAHDCIIGDYVTFAPGVKCNGHVVIEDHAYIGTGAIIKDGTHKPITIGKGAVVGMGAVVTKSVPPGVIVVGNPAKPFKKD
jgi:sugar O-acyltransferase (sialic acid O-acetyltransferase NeuD family)